MRLTGNKTQSAPQAAIAQVSFSDSAGFGAVTASEMRGTSMFAPRGITYQPCEGDRLLMMNIGGTESCVGCLSIPEGLDGGEIRISSAGGANILLKNTGEIILNGLTITKEGRIIEAVGR